jgi:phosphomannomutase
MNHITIRSSGTEPKIRIFIQYRITNLDKNDILEKKSYAENLVKTLSDEIEKLITTSN